jgi:hypothetical protein
MGAYYKKYQISIRNFTHSWYINREKESNGMRSAIGDII